MNGDVLVSIWNRVLCDLYCAEILSDLRELTGK